MTATPTTPTNVATGSQGIQVLLEAEKEASRIVQKARQHRAQRLKDARKEATDEIETLKKKKQEEFAVFESSVLGSLEGDVTTYAQETEVRLNEIEEIAKVGKADVAQLLLDTVLRVDPKIHQNVALRMAQ